MLAAEGCDGGDPTLPAEQQPQPVRADSRIEGADKGTTGSDYGAISKLVRASAQPASIAETVLVPIDVPGVFSVHGGHTLATTTMLEGGVREACAVSEIADITLGKVVRLTGLRWEVVHHSGASDTKESSFVIGGATIGGIAIPVDSVQSVADAVNKALEVIGIQLILPVQREGAGTLFVEPLQIAIVPARARDDLLAPIINDIYQPARQPVFDLLRDITCKINDLITISDIAVGSVSGAGRFSLELGGVSATTGEFDLSNKLGGSGTRLPALPLVSVPRPALRPAPVVGSVTPVVTPPAVNQPARSAPRIAVQPVVSTEDERGGMLAVLAALGLLLLATLAELDRRRIRRVVVPIPEEG